MFIKIKNLINFLLFQFISLFVKAGKTAKVKNTMLIIRLDAIGDYILFRNFLQKIKEDDKYRNYKITLCGNIIWKDMAQSLDKDYVDFFIWIDRKKFYSNVLYKLSVLREINKKGFEIVISPTYTREILYGDQIVWASDAPVRIGTSGALDKHLKWKKKLFSDKYYTQLISSSTKNILEFYRNKEFFERVLSSKINISKPECNASKIDARIDLPERYVVLFPGSKEPSKRWAPENFAKVAKVLIDKYSFKIVIPGGPSDKKISQEICEALNTKEIVDLSGKNSLLQLIKIISGAVMLISNDSVAVHIALSVNTRFICISNGWFFGRFHPYPKEIFSESYYVYPDEVEKNLSNKEFLEKIRFNSKININQIKPEKICRIAEEILTTNTDKGIDD